MSRPLRQTLFAASLGLLLAASPRAVLASHPSAFGNGGMQTPASVPGAGTAVAAPGTTSAPAVQSLPNLPPMEPTSLKPGGQSNAIPPFPSPLPASVGTRGTAATASPARPGTTAGGGAGTLAPGPTAGGGAGTLAPGPLSNKPVRNAPLPNASLANSPFGIAVTPGEMRVSGLGGSSAPWSIVVLLTGLTLLPSLLICVTPFARLLVVFHFLRQALGLQTTPSNQTLIGLTMILTFFIMEPVGKQIYQQSIEPLQRGQITAFEAMARGQEPMRNFMVHYVREKDAALFLEIAKEPRPRDIHDLSMRVLLPAYIVSELKAGFQIGAVLFLPFLVVDMVVASITTSVGMMQLPPVVISTPLKLLLFLMVDGWHLLISALMRSFQ